MPSRSRSLLGLGVLIAAGLGATLSPTRAAEGVQPVSGGLTQAYRATYHVRPTLPAIPSVRYFLTGTPDDEMNKVKGVPSASFRRTGPTSTTALTQQTSPAPSVASDNSADAGSAYWTAPLTGSFDAPMTISWWWSTNNPLAADGNLLVRVWADPGTAAEKEISRALTGVTIAGGQPHRYTLRVQLKGAVRRALRVQATPYYIDAGHDLTVHYGSVGADSWVELPKGRHPRAPLPSTERIKETRPLVVSATAIGRDAGEPTIGVTKQGNAFMAAAAGDALSPANGRTMVYASKDGNATWRNTTPLVAGEPVPPVTLDPYVYVDPDTGRVFNDDLTGACSHLTWSDDEGKTWSQGNPLACEAPGDDHQTLVTGVPPRSVTTESYPKVVYYCANKVVGVQCARSLDGGTTFRFTGSQPYLSIEQGTEGGEPENCSGLHGHASTDRSGRLFLPKEHCGRPLLAISEDAGTTWRVSVVSRIRAASTDPSIAADSAGNLYYLFLGADDLLPYLVVSRDHGRTWGPALLVAPPGLAAANFPTLAAGGKGHIALSFPGSTWRDDTAGRPWNYYVAVSTDALAARPTFHSTTANPVADPIHRGPCLERCAGMLDFLDVVIAPRTGELWAAASDTCTSASCVAARPSQTTNPGARDARGIAIRQLRGPGVQRR